MKTKATAPTTTLPPDVLSSDTKYPPFRKNGARVVDSLMFYNVTSFGWCIATLLIRGPGRRSAAGATARTYAVRVDDGSLVRIGLGPHVTQTVHVYVTDKRLAKLQKYLALRDSGAIKANETRDRISTRRARSAQRRDYILGW